MELLGMKGGCYRPLSDTQVETIHQASLDILEKIGFTYEAGLDDLLDLLAKAGARVTRSAARVYFPRDLIMAEVAKAPSRFTLYGRGGRPDLDLGGDRVYMGTGGAAIKILDLMTGQARPTTLRDIYELGRLVDQLDNIHFYLRPCVPTDLPQAAYDVNTYFTCLKATGKHVMSGVVDLAGFQQVMELAVRLAGSPEALAERPILSAITCNAISPLKFCTQSSQNMAFAVRHRIPVALSAAPMAGSTSPLTMAGTLAQLHAEQLASIALCQLINPGAPVLYGGIPGTANLRTMDYQGGAVECGMMNAAIHQLSRRIEVPNYNSSGLTDAKLPDAQAGWEKGMSTLLVAMGGSNFVHHAAGMLESMLAVAPEQYVIDDEIIGMSEKLLKGITVDDEHLALEALAEVGPGGNFLTNRHTLRHLKDEYYQGNGVTDRRSRGKWQEAGGKDTRTRAQEMARRLLAGEEKSYLPAEVEKEIRERYAILL